MCPGLLRRAETLRRPLAEDKSNTPILANTVAEEAVNVTIAVDRVRIPMEEDRELTDEDRQCGVERPVSRVLRMAYCGVWTLHDKDGEPLHGVRYAGAPDRGNEGIEASLREDLLVVLATRPHLRVVTLGDGAPEMQNILDRVTAGVEVEARLLDFWHLTAKLGDAARASGEPVKQSVQRYKGMLRRDDAAIEVIETEVKTWAAPYLDEGEELPEGLHHALTYIENNRERLRYATHRSAGLPIGSGHVEATCKTIVTVRCKRSGSRWRPDGAQAVLVLRALATSSLGARNGASSDHVRDANRGVSGVIRARATPQHHLTSHELDILGSAARNRIRQNRLIRLVRQE